MGLVRYVVESVRWFPNRLWGAWLRLADEFDRADLERNPHRGEM